MSATDDFLSPSRQFLKLGNPGLFIFPADSGTAGLKFGGASVNMVLQSSIFQYTVLADRCVFFLNMQIGNKGASVGNATILMPWGGVGSTFGFSPAVNSEAIIFKPDTVNMTGFLGGFIEVTATGFNVKSMAINGASAFLTDVNFASPSFFTAQGHFQIARLGS